MEFWVDTPPHLENGCGVLKFAVLRATVILFQFLSDVSIWKMQES
jgi:hypothetical protein